MSERDDKPGMIPTFRDLAEALSLGMPFQIRVPRDGQGREFTFLGDRWANRREAAVEALKMLAESARSVAAGKSTVKSA